MRFWPFAIASDGNRNIRLVIKDVIGALRFAAGNKLAAHNNAAFGEGDLLANLHHPVPTSALDGGADKLGTDVALAEVFLVHTFYWPTSGLCVMAETEAHWVRFTMLH